MNENNIKKYIDASLNQIKTFKEASKNDASCQKKIEKNKDYQCEKEYISKSEVKAIDFDEVALNYKNKDNKHYKSVDSLLFFKNSVNENIMYFVEFKSNFVEGIKDMKEKILSSFTKIFPRDIGGKNNHFKIDQLTNNSTIIFLIVSPENINRIQNINILKIKKCLIEKINFFKNKNQMNCDVEFKHMTGTKFDQTIAKIDTNNLYI